MRREFEAYLASQLTIAETLGLDQIGLPMSSDTIESLFGVAKRHGTGQTQDAARIALRLPALCGASTHEEANLSIDYENPYGTHFASPQPPCVIENMRLLDMREAAAT
ncbi:MAG: hypothetical protein ETSY2_11740 [Candidatus Entotheonella gemina]|uniref:Uncharacterized protein n=1 Tax=Candidatus Entotheonella gemina TaxID=1429439 RepID=W4MAG9_9BACT|nr:MAG: hypothetical protein ETSY2_11740 [Candidatus Entotheonella gemina]